MNKNWLEISVHTSSEAVEAVTNKMLELGLNGVAIEDSEVLTRDWESPYGEIISLSEDDYPAEGAIVKGYLPGNCNHSELVQQIKKLVDNLKGYGLDPGPGRVMLRNVTEESWAHAWKKFYKPIRVTEKLTVKPRWEEYTPQTTGEIVIELDPGMAFGTGTHPTTLQCLRLLEKWLQPGMHIIDVGCGSGILSIAAAKMGAKTVLAIDLDEIAVKSAKENVLLSGHEHQIQVLQGDLLQFQEKPAHLIVANLLAEIILRLVEDLPSALQPGGIFIGAGIVANKADLVEKALSEVGLKIMERIHDEDWVAIVAKKMVEC